MKKPNRKRNNLGSLNLVPKLPLSEIISEKIMFEKIVDVVFWVLVALFFIWLLSTLGINNKL